MNSKFQIQNYMDAVEKGRVTKAFDPSGRYILFSYSKETSFSRDWDFVTITSRGHVWDTHTGRCVGAPFDKFFNLGELSPSVEGTFRNNTVLKDFVSRWTPEQMSEVTPWNKLDGSMGLVWLDHDGNVRVNTPGAFHSDQAQWAMSWLDKNRDVKDRIQTLLSDSIWHSLCVEIIYHGNKVVVPYPASAHGLHLTGVTICPHKYWEYKFDSILPGGIEMSSLWGRWASPETLEMVAQEIGLSCVERLNAKPSDLIEKASNDGTGDACEGWVFQIPSGSRIKIKCVDYVRVHRVVTNVHANRVKDILEGEGCWFKIKFSESGEAFENWVAAKAALHDWLIFIDEECRAPYEELVDSVISDVELQAAKVIKCYRSAKKAKLYTPELYAKAVHNGSITISPDISVGHICDMLRGNGFAVNVKEIFLKRKELIWGGNDE